MTIIFIFVVLLVEEVKKLSLTGFPRRLGFYLGQFDQILLSLILSRDRVYKFLVIKVVKLFKCFCQFVYEKIHKFGLGIKL